MLSGVTPTYTVIFLRLKSMRLKSLVAVAASINGFAQSSNPEFKVEITLPLSLSGFWSHAAKFIYPTGCICFPIVSRATAMLYGTSLFFRVLTTSPNDLIFSGTAMRYSTTPTNKLRASFSQNSCFSKIKLAIFCTSSTICPGFLLIQSNGL